MCLQENLYREDSAWRFLQTLPVASFLLCLHPPSSSIDFVASRLEFSYRVHLCVLCKETNQGIWTVLFHLFIFCRAFLHAVWRRISIIPVLVKVTSST